MQNRLTVKKLLTLEKLSIAIWSLIVWVLVNLITSIFGAITGQIVEGIDPETNQTIQITRKFSQVFLEKVIDVPVWGWVLLGIGLGLLLSIWFDKEQVKDKPQINFKFTGIASRPLEVTPTSNDQVLALMEHPCILYIQFAIWNMGKPARIEKIETVILGFDGRRHKCKLRIFNDFRAEQINPNAPTEQKLSETVFYKVIEEEPILGYDNFIVDLPSEVVDNPNTSIEVTMTDFYGNKFKNSLLLADF